MGRVARGSGYRNTTYYQNEDDSCEEKITSMEKRVVPARSFSSKLELDAGLESMFELAVTNETAAQDEDPVSSEDGQEEDETLYLDDENDDEFNLVRHLMEPQSPTHLESHDVGARTKFRKKGRRKRGASLERMIAKMILQTSGPGQEDSAPAAIDEPTLDSVTAKDILSDLVKTVDTASSFSGQSKETTPWANTSGGAVTKASSSESIPKREQPQPASLLSVEDRIVEETEELLMEVQEKEPVKDDFGFDIDDGWTAFDDCTPFDTLLFSSQNLDNNGFPLVRMESEAGDNRPGELEADEEYQAEEEELAADLIKEMEEEVAKDGVGIKKATSLRARFVASQVGKIEGTEAEEITKKVLEQQQKQRERAMLEEEEKRRMAETGAIAKQRAAENERVEQDMAKELARRIAKEQEWGKLQEMAQELARKQQEVEMYQELERRSQVMQSVDRAEHRRPFAFEEVEVTERSDFSDDEVSSLPTTQSIDSRSLSQFYTKENNISFLSRKVQRNELSPPAMKKSEVPPPASSPETIASERKEVQPNSPSSVADLNTKPVSNTNQNRTMAISASQRFRQTRVVFSNRQVESSPASRPKPTWNPKPPKHYNRSTNGL